MFIPFVLGDGIVHWIRDRIGIGIGTDRVPISDPIETVKAKSSFRLLLTVYRVREARITSKLLVLY